MIQTEITCDLCPQSWISKNLLIVNYLVPKDEILMEMTIETITLFQLLRFEKVNSQNKIKSRLFLLVCLSLQSTDHGLKNVNRTPATD